MRIQQYIVVGDLCDAVCGFSLSFSLRCTIFYVKSLGMGGEGDHVCFSHLVSALLLNSGQQLQTLDQSEVAIANSAGRGASSLQPVVDKNLSCSMMEIRIPVCTAQGGGGSFTIGNT